MVPKFMLCCYVLVVLSVAFSPVFCDDGDFSQQDFDFGAKIGTANDGIASGSGLSPTKSENRRWDSWDFDDDPVYANDQPSSPPSPFPSFGGLPKVTTSTTKSQLLLRKGRQNPLVAPSTLPTTMKSALKSPSSSTPAIGSGLLGLDFQRQLQGLVGSGGQNQDSKSMDNIKEELSHMLFGEGGESAGGNSFADNSRETIEENIASSTPPWKSREIMEPLPVPSIESRGIYPFPDKRPYMPVRDGRWQVKGHLRKLLPPMRAKKGPRRKGPNHDSAESQLNLGGKSQLIIASMENASSIGENGDCHHYTDNLCIEAKRYPEEKILNILNKNHRVGSDLVADVTDQDADELIDGVTSAQESKYTVSHYYGENRRQGNKAATRDFAQDGGFLCPSEIMYARPKRGKTAQGEWKDIVNVKDYTQTLRMEKCLKPGGSCSYVSHHYKSQCSQVYNYHRLLSWNKERGLHMDIYKVPTCCSCHIMGYSYLYPPLKKTAFSKKKEKKHHFQSIEIEKPEFFSHDDEYDYVDDVGGEFVGGFVPSKAFPKLPNDLRSDFPKGGFSSSAIEDDEFSKEVDEDFKNFISSLDPKFSASPSVISPSSAGFGEDDEELNQSVRDDFGSFEEGISARPPRKRKTPRKNADVGPGRGRPPPFLRPRLRPPGPGGRFPPGAAGPHRHGLPGGGGPPRGAQRFNFRNSNNIASRRSDMPSRPEEQLAPPPQRRQQQPLPQQQQQQQPLRRRIQPKQQQQRLPLPQPGNRNAQKLPPRERLQQLQPPPQQQQQQRKQQQQQQRLPPRRRQQQQQRQQQPNQKTVIRPTLASKRDSTTTGKPTIRTKQMLILEPSKIPPLQPDPSPKIFDKSVEEDIVKELQISAERSDENPEDAVKSVNYAYHPIIDFFDRYRWSKASRRRK